MENHISVTNPASAKEVCVGYPHQSCYPTHLSQAYADSDREYDGEVWSEWKGR